MRINLIPPEERARQRLVRLEPIVAVVGIFVVAAAVVAASFNQQQLTEAGRRVESLQRMVAQLQPYQEQLTQVREETRKLEEALQRAKDQAKQEAAALPLSELMRLVADAARRTGTVWLTRFAASQGRLQVEGLATDAASVTGFLAQLTAGGVLRQTQGGVTPVDASGSTGSGTGPGGGARGDLVRFSSEFRVSGVSEVGSSARGTP